MVWVPNGYGNSIGWYKPATIVVATTTWNSPPVTGIALSGGNLIATRTAAYDGGILCSRSVASYSSGKKFGSFVVNAYNTTWIGLCNSNFNLTTGNPAASLDSCVSVGSGTTFINGGAGTNPTFGTDGDVVDMAVDFGAKLIWFRVNGSAWNDGTGNPATGVGGTDISSMNAGPYFVLGSFLTDTSSWTANFGASAYTYAAPSGFGNW